MFRTDRQKLDVGGVAQVLSACPSAAHAFQLTGHSNWCRFLPLVLESNMPLHLDTFSPHSLSTWTPQNPRNFLVVDADGDILQVS